MKNIFILFPLMMIMMILIFSCTTTRTIHGTVAMKINNQTGHISLGSSDVTKGEKLLIYRQNCMMVSEHSQERFSPPCRKVKVGEGEVTDVLSENYSIIKTLNDVVLQEGDVVEKINQ